VIKLIVIMLLGFAGLYWWHSGDFKGRARNLATAHCNDLDLQLLDQSVVISGLWPKIDQFGKWQLRRRYQFEFTSTGRQRYRGEMSLLGMSLDSIELEAYAID
jgi:hypothetical protein